MSGSWQHVLPRKTNLQQGHIAAGRHCSRATLRQSELCVKTGGMQSGGMQSGGIAAGHNYNRATFAAGRHCSRANLQASGAARRTCSRANLQQNQLAAGPHCSRATVQQGDTAAERICRLPERPEVDFARPCRRSEACRDAAPSHASQLESSQNIT